MDSNYSFKKFDLICGIVVLHKLFHSKAIILHFGVSKRVSPIGD